MEHYLTYKKLIELLKNNLPIKIKSFNTGDLSYLGKENNPDLYPLMHVVPNQITYDENTTQFNLSILFCDIVNTDMSNEVTVISDMNLSCRDFLSQIKLGVFYDYFDTTLPNSATTFMERFNDHLGGVELTIPVTIFEDMNACDQYEPVSPSPTPTVTPSITPSSSCQVTTQYLEVIFSSCHNFKLSLFNDPSFTSPANALCNYIVSGCAYGDLGTVYCGTETILNGQHNHNFNLNPVLQPGECVTGFTVNSVDTSTCTCPVIVNFTPYITPTPTPTPTITSTPTPSITPSLTPTTTPSITPSITPTSSETPTPTPTTSVTPTPTPSPSPITWNFRYIASSAAVGTRQVSNASITFNGITLTRPTFTWGASINSVVTLGTNFNTALDNFNISRDLCRQSGSGSLFLDYVQIEIKINGTTVYNTGLINISPNITPPLCPTTDSRNQITGNFQVNLGDTVEAIWTDVFTF